MKAHQEFVDKNLNEAFMNFYAGFLSTKEMAEIIDGRDLWLNKDQVASRWAKRKLLLADKTPFESITEVVVAKKRGRPKKDS